jgi:hypothetical protein
VEESNFLFSQATNHTMLIMIALQIKNEIHLNQGYDGNRMQQTDILESVFYLLIKPFDKYGWTRITHPTHTYVWYL